MITPEPGTYALVFASSTAASIHVGKLGSLQLQPGFYVYVGSAHGPGGLRARLAHHLKPSTRPHWHLDYLKAHTNPEEVWYCVDHRPWEHEWALRVGTQPGASVPLGGFGASDCLCETHLFFFESHPSPTALARNLQAIGRWHPPVRLYGLKP